MELIAFFSKVSGAEWAAWVQAVGSVAAIAASVWLVDRSHRLQVKLAADEAAMVKLTRSRNLSMLLILYERALKDAAALARKATTQAEWKELEHRFEAFRDATEHVTVDLYDDFASTEALLLFSATAKKMLPEVKLRADEGTADWEIEADGQKNFAKMALEHASKMRGLHVRVYQGTLGETE